MTANELQKLCESVLQVQKMCESEQEETLFFMLNDSNLKYESVALSVKDEGDDLDSFNMGEYIANVIGAIVEDQALKKSDRVIHSRSEFDDLFEKVKNLLKSKSDAIDDYLIARGISRLQEDVVRHFYSLYLEAIKESGNDPEYDPLDRRELNSISPAREGYNTDYTYDLLKEVREVAERVIKELNIKLF